MARRPLAALLTALALACPGTALAQSAGDDQYEDPFPSGQEQEQPAPEAAPEPAPEAAPEAVPEAAPEAAPAPQGTPAPAAAAAAGQEQLPYTGLETGLVAAAGALLLGTGATLRRHATKR